MQTNCDLRVLLVEDDTSSRELMGIVLEDAGFLVAEAASADEAHDHLRTTRFDVVLVDLYLPDLRGLELVREAQALWPGAGAVIVTGAVEADLDLEGLPVLHKPLDLARFVHCVGNEALRGRRQWMARRRLNRPTGEVNRVADDVWRTRLERLDSRIGPASSRGASRERRADQDSNAQEVGDPGQS